MNHIFEIPNPVYELLNVQLLEAVHNKSDYNIYVLTNKGHFSQLLFYKSYTCLVNGIGT